MASVSRQAWLEDPAADLDDEPGFLGQADELARHEQAPPGCLPADQRLEPDDRAVGEVDHRLVVERAARRDPRRRGAVPRAPRARWRLRAGSAGRPRSGPCRARFAWYIAKSALRSSSVTPSLSAPGVLIGDPDARGDDGGGAADPDRWPQGVDDPLGDDGRLGLVAQLLEQDGELVTPQPGGRVAAIGGSSAAGRPPPRGAGRRRRGRGSR